MNYGKSTHSGKSGNRQRQERHTKGGTSSKNNKNKANTRFSRSTHANSFGKRKLRKTIAWVKFFIVFAILIGITLLCIRLDILGARALYEQSTLKMQDLIYGEIKTITINGNKILTKREIMVLVYNLERDINGPKSQKHKANAWQVKPAKDIEKQLASIPVIQSATVDRRTLGTLAIHIVEHEPMLRYYNKETKKFGSISTQYSAFNYENHNKKLPFYRGIINVERLSDLYKLLRTHSSILPHITEIENFHDYRWNIVLDNKIFVSLPQKRENVALQTLEQYISDHNILNKNIKTLNLSVEGKIFISRYTEQEPHVYIPQPKTIITSVNNSKNTKPRAGGKAGKATFKILEQLKDDEKSIRRFGV